MSKYTFNHSKCINCASENCLRFIKWYKHYDIVGVHKPPRIDTTNNIQEYQCKECRVFIGHNLKEIAFKKQNINQSRGGKEVNSAEVVLEANKKKRKKRKNIEQKICHKD